MAIIDDLDLPVLPRAYKDFDWTTSNGSATAEQTILGYQQLMNNGYTLLFSHLIWNDIVNKIKDIYDIIGYDWDTTYATYEECVMSLPGHAVMTAAIFNSVADNIGRIRDVVYGWESTGDSGRLGRRIIYGYATHKNDADILYGWYIPELTAKLNLLIDILRGHYYEFCPVGNLGIIGGTYFPADILKGRTAASAFGLSSFNYQLDQASIGVAASIDFGLSDMKSLLAASVLAEQAGSIVAPIVSMLATYGESRNTKADAKLFLPSYTKFIGEIARSVHAPSKLYLPSHTRLISDIATTVRTVGKWVLSGVFHAPLITYQGLPKKLKTVWSPLTLLESTLSPSVKHETADVLMPMGLANATYADTLYAFSRYFWSSLFFGQPDAGISSHYYESSILSPVSHLLGHLSSARILDPRGFNAAPWIFAGSPAYAGIKKASLNKPLPLVGMVSATTKYDYTSQGEVEAVLPSSIVADPSTKAAAKGVGSFKHVGLMYATPQTMFAPEFYDTASVSSLDWTVVKYIIDDLVVPAPVGNYVTFVGNSLTLRATKGWNGTMEYSVGEGVWLPWNGEQITGANNYILLRGSGNTRLTNGSSSGSNYRFILGGSRVCCFGNIETLLDYATVAAGNHPTKANYCFSNLFYQNTALLSARLVLPVVSGQYMCYRMFQGCTNLKYSPILSATSVTAYCYSYMFYGCTALVDAPDLPATSLATQCYSYMFYNCQQLKNPPKISARTTSTYCCQYMFYGCTSLKTIPSFSSITALSTSCFQNMFQGCTGLEGDISVQTSASTLAVQCYYGMFRGCTHIQRVISFGHTGSTTVPSACFSYMFYGCTSLTEVLYYYAGGTSIGSTCFAYMFYGCTHLKRTRIRIARNGSSLTLGSQCCYYMYFGCTALTEVNDEGNGGTNVKAGSQCFAYMFTGCSNLKYGRVNFSTLANYCCTAMYRNCYSLENCFSSISNQTLAPYCFQQMFQNCRSLTGYGIELQQTSANYAYCFAQMFSGCTSLKNAPTMNPTTYGDHSCYEMFQGCTSLTIPPSLQFTSASGYSFGYMCNGCSSMKLSATQTDEYTRSYRLPRSGTATTTSTTFESMFLNTGGTFTGTPVAGTTYYYSRT